MSGGIQKGGCSFSEKSLYLDKIVKLNSEFLYRTEFFSNAKIKWTPKLTKDEIPGGIGACQPDGGCWWYVNGDKKELILVVEAKYQGKKVMLLKDGLKITLFVEK